MAVNGSTVDSEPLRDTAPANSPNLSDNIEDSFVQSNDGSYNLPTTDRPRSFLGNIGPLRQAPLDEAQSLQTQNRVYSQHGSFFTRNVDSARAPPADFPVAGPSRQVHQQLPLSLRGANSKKPETTVTILATTDSVDDLEVPSRDIYPRRTPHQRSCLDAIKQRSYLLSVLVKNIQDAHRKVYNHINGHHEIPSGVNGRRIGIHARRQTDLLDGRTDRPYVNNSIRSNKYDPWTFLPKQLVAQFSKLANFYFLCISILQLIPGLSTTGTYTTILPLLFFVSLSIAKEGYEDLRRHRLDKVENSSIATVLSSDQTMSSIHDKEPVNGTLPLPWQATKWQDIQVGDIVRLQRDEAIPADLVVMHVQGTNSIAYVETMALDGETNLKSKAALSLLKTHCTSINDIIQCRGQIVAEDPNLDLYNFNGKLTLNGQTLPLTNNEILYRGSILRNTLEVIGIVIYSGEESKIRMNATKNPRIKAPALQTAVNKVVVLIAIFVLALAIWNTAAYQIWKSTERKSWYLADASVSFVPILVSFIILFNTMLPLSLYVSLEIVKVFQILFMNDIEMYHRASDTPMESRTSTINEELGQVTHIFSDKTGTLTNNSMRFRKMSVAGSALFHDTDTLEDGTREDVKPLESHTNESRTTKLLEYLQHRPQTGFAKTARLFLLSIALCHTCIPEIDEKGAIEYQATSPDELALVKAAEELGFILVDRQSGKITIKQHNFEGNSAPSFEEYCVLRVIEFSSRRKRMSIIVRMPDNRICIFCKGADSTMVQLLRLSGIAAEQVAKVEDRTKIRKSMEAQEILRRKSEQQARDSTGRSSLNIGRASLGGIRPSFSGMRLESIRNEFTDWLRDASPVQLPERISNFRKSPRTSALSPIRRSLAFSDRLQSSEDIVKDSPPSDEVIFGRCFQHLNEFATEGLRTLLYGYKFIDESEYASWQSVYDDASTSLVNRQEKVESAAEVIEQNLELAGVTAIEDKLQDGVPWTINQLRRANVKIWMLTGDKRETAINIGRSCQLIQDYSMVTILDDETGDVGKRIASALETLLRNDVAHSVIVIDGHTLTAMDGQGELFSQFLDIAILVDSVICCRASPSQKASLVRSVRKKVGNAVTLAIGDGANDIAMIQEAHVGIGITGKEGLQAARTSDYSIAQFRFLSRLLLVHGRWNYVRICKYTLGTFWKEMLFYLTQALYQRFTGYTGTSLYESWSLSMFNTLFTSLCVIFMGIFEKDLKAETLLAIPELYTFGQRNEGFNLKEYLRWVFMASSEAIIIFWLMVGLFGNAIFTDDNALFGMGVVSFTASIIVINTKMQFIELHNKTYTCAIVLVVSNGGWFMWNLILSAVYVNNTIYDVKDGFLDRWGKNPLWWLCLVLILICVWVFELAVKYLRICWKASDVDVFQQLENDKVCWERIQASAKDPLESSADGAHMSNVERLRKAEEQAEREGKVQELLNQPRIMVDYEGHEDVVGLRRRHSDHDGNTEIIELDDLDTSKEHKGKGVDRNPRRSVDVSDILRKGFGSVRRSLDIFQN